jgi:hypothetical protein
MAAIAEQGHADILPDPPPTTDLVSVTIRQLELEAGRLVRLDIPPRSFQVARG